MKNQWTKFAFPGFSYTILLLLTTENIEVGSWQKQRASIESSQKSVYKTLKQFSYFPSRFQVIGVGIARKSEKCSAKGLALA